MELFKTTHNLVIMDGSSKEKVAKILTKVGDIIGKRTKCIVHVSRLDTNHPTMVVVEYATGLVKNSKLKKELEKQYPGLCIYDVAV